MVRKHYRQVEVINKVGKASYRIQLLQWMRELSPVVLVSNMKRYSPNQEDVKYKEATRPHEKKKNFQAKKVGEAPTEKTPRVNKPRSSFQQFLADWKRLLNAKISWKRVRDLKSASTYITEFVKSRLTEMSTN